MPSLLPDTSTAPSSALNTPDASSDVESRVVTEGKSASAKKAAGDATENGRKEVDRAKMPPPPLPIKGTSAAAPRMARMPSLSEITSHLHIPTSTISPKTPPRLAVNTNPTTVPSSSAALGSALGSAPSPYTASPSGRLKLPASAMMRTRSGSSSQVVTLASLAKMERTGSSDGQGTPKSALPDSAKNSPLAGTDAASPQPDSATHSRQASREYVEGYKDVPSLAAIRQRINYAQGPGAGDDKDKDKAQVPAPSQKGKKHDEEDDLETVETLLEDDKGEDIALGTASTSATIEAELRTSKGQQHMLQHPWTMYFDAKSYMPPVEQSAGKDGGGDYEKSLLRVGRIDSVEAFARHMNNLRLPSVLKPNSNYHLFKGDIRPMWEDPANHAGGKWVILFRQCPHLFDIAWANLTMGLIGQMLDAEDGVCGIVASNKPRAHRLQIWTRDRENVEILNVLGQRILDMMKVEKSEMEGISFEYQYNASDAYPPANAFINISFASRGFTPSTPSRLGMTASPSLNFPSPAGSGTSHLSPALSSANPSPTPSTHPLPLHPRPGNLTINVIPQHQGSSPLRGENRPVSPMITPTPSPKLAHHLPRPPNSETIKASTLSPSMSSPSLSGGTGMKRLGSGQGSNAFAGPMVGSRSPRAEPARLAGV